MSDTCSLGVVDFVVVLVDLVCLLICLFVCFFAPFSLLHAISYTITFHMVCVPGSLSLTAALIKPLASSAEYGETTCSTTKSDNQ